MNLNKVICIWYFSSSSLPRECHNFVTFVQKQEYFF